MNATLPPVLATALAPFAPPASVVHQIVRDDAAQRRAEAARIADQQRWLSATSQGYDFPRDFNTVDSRL